MHSISRGFSPLAEVADTLLRLLQRFAKQYHFWDRELLLKRELVFAVAAMVEPHRIASKKIDVDGKS